MKNKLLQKLKFHLPIILVSKKNKLLIILNFKINIYKI